MILFALMEPDEGNVFVDVMLMSPGCEEYKVPPPEGLLDEFRRFLGLEKTPNLLSCEYLDVPEADFWPARFSMRNLRFDRQS